MGFNLKDYEEVKDRIPKFLADPDLERPRIVTRLLTSPADIGTEAVFVAELYDGDALLATGHAYEWRLDTNSRQVNATSWVENCETSAIGRALANGGWASGKNRPSREEIEKVKRALEDPQLKDDYKAIIAAAQKASTINAVRALLGDPSSHEAGLATYAAMDDSEREAVKLAAQSEAASVEAVE